MGYCYTRSGALVCDSCNASGGVKKVSCPVGYCPPPALCAACKKKHADKLTLKAHESCVVAKAEMILREKKRVELMASGKPVRCAALATNDNRVHVLFAKEPTQAECVGYFMSHEAYDAIPLLENATPEDYAKFGPLEPAPEEFNFAL